MSFARYLFRLDDISPTMAWPPFLGLTKLLFTHGIRPLLGIIPNCCDERLRLERPRPEFWEIVRNLHAQGLVDIAQHGYRHVLVPTSPERFSSLTEFAGKNYEKQRQMLVAGQAILREEGIFTDSFVPPQHSFDENTLKALAATGFRSVSEGTALFPFLRGGLTFVPQQFWRPRQMPFGVITILLHSNYITREEIRRVEEFVRLQLCFTSFSEEVARYSDNGAKRLANFCFEGIYRSCCSVMWPESVHIEVAPAHHTAQQ